MRAVYIQTIELQQITLKQPIIGKSQESMQKQNVINT